MCVHYVKYSRRDRRIDKKKGVPTSGNVITASGQDASEQQESEDPGIFPGDLGEILIEDDDGNRRYVASSYGLVAPWLPKATGRPTLLYNCRDDSLTLEPKKVSFAQAFYHRRCITEIEVIEENLGNDNWLRIHPMPPMEYFAVASLYNHPNDHCKTVSHCLVTTSPNEVIKPWHDRMPVILSPEGIDLWLNPETPENVLLSLLTPCPDDWIGEMTKRKVKREPKAKPEKAPKPEPPRQEGMDFGDE